MASKNFIVKNGLTVGSLEIDAASGNITTTGTLAVSNVQAANIYLTGGVPLGGSDSVTATNDTTTNSDFYPVFVATTGNLETVTASISKLYFNPSTGTLNATSFNTLSDISIKENVQTLIDPLAKVMNMRGVEFNWKDTDQKSMGVIAQEVEQIFPDIVSTNKNGIKSVSYDSIVGLLIESIKEQQKQINELKQIIKELR